MAYYGLANLPSALASKQFTDSTYIPTNNHTALNKEIAPAWMPSAQTRGTADLLYSCILTLTLCVYTALHLNVPALGEAKWKQHLRKAKWAVVGIFAPEVILFTALSQHLSARMLCAELRGIIAETQKTTSTSGQVDNVAVSNPYPLHWIRLIVLVFSPPTHLKRPQTYNPNSI